MGTESYKTTFYAFFSLLMLWICAVPAAAASQCPPLGDCSDPALQQDLEICLTDLNLNGAADRQLLCVALVDLTDPAAPRMAAVNGHTMMYAASLPKIAILLGAFERIEQGHLQFDPATQTSLTRMIRNSSNRAATDMLNRVGKDFLVDLLQSRRYRLYDPDLNGGLWVGKEYGKNPAWRRDPLYNLSHGATAYQAARFYYLLQAGRLVSDDASRRMKTILSKPAINHKFVKGLSQVTPGAQIFRKSGSWGRFHADSALVERDGHTYIAVALADSTQGEKWLQRLIVGLDRLIISHAQPTSPDPSPKPSATIPLSVSTRSIDLARGLMPFSDTVPR